MMFRLYVGDWSVHVIKLFDMLCIGYVRVTQRKDPEEELLRAILGALRWQYSDDPHRDSQSEARACVSHGTSTCVHMGECCLLLMSV